MRIGFLGKDSQTIQRIANSPAISNLLCKRQTLLQEFFSFGGLAYVLDCQAHETEGVSDQHRVAHLASERQCFHKISLRQIVVAHFKGDDSKELPYHGLTPWVAILFSFF